MAGLMYNRCGVMPAAESMWLSCAPSDKVHAKAIMVKAIFFIFTGSGFILNPNRLVFL